MIDIKYIRQNPEEVQQNCLNRGVKLDISQLLNLDESRRNLLHDIEGLRSQKKKQSKSKPTPEEIQALKKEGIALKALEEKLKEVEIAYKHLFMQVPNLTHPEVPIGEEGEGRVIKQVGQVPSFSFQAQDHLSFLEKAQWLDFERGAKVSGNKFYFSRSDLVRLNLALIQYGIDTITPKGYELVETPDLAKNEILEGIGFNPKGKGTNIYSVEDSSLSLIGTAEITMGGFHSQEVLDLSQGPKKYVALSHCYRTEAGAYGRDSKGLYRVHQFTKLELFIFCKPQDSEGLHQEILSIEEELCQGLGFPYRVVDIPSKDLGGPAYRKYDIEAWMLSKGKSGDFGEITSCSNCLDYQARRLNTRYRNEEGKLDFVHTLNGTAIVSSRFPIAIVENFQNEKGGVDWPEVLMPYLGSKLK